ncbi:MAG: hypothetical protein ACK59M_18085, partial [Pseudomonadota bacterium]
MGDSFGQLAAVSAVLGGFVMTFLGVLLGTADTRRRVGLSLALAATAAGCLLLAAVGWSLLAAQVALVSAADGDWAVTARQQLDAGLRLQRLLRFAFMCGIALLIALIGSTGWLRSRSLGIFTATLAGLLAVGAVVVVWPWGGGGATNPRGG